MTHYSTIKNGGSHTDETIIFNSAGMQGNTMSDSYVITNDTSILIRHMQTAVILNIAIPANNYLVNITTQGRIRPYACILLKFNVTNQGCCAKGISLFINNRISSLKLIYIVLSILLLNFYVFHI